MLLNLNKIDNKNSRATMLRSFSINEKNILTTIFHYNIEVNNFIATFSTLSILLVRSIRPAPFLLSQVIIVTLATAWSLTFIQGFSVSFFKLLLVTHFHQMFPLDPDQFGQHIFVMSLAFAAIPNSIIGVYITLQGTPASQFVHFTANMAGTSKGIIPYNFIYTALCAIICVVMLFIAVIYVPLHLKKLKQNNSSIQAGEAFSDKKIPDLR
jgi:hypothetical protein